MARVKTKEPSGKPARNGRRKRARPASAGRGTEASLAAYAHDIRTALTGILALGELLASSNLGERERRWALGIRSSAKHIASLTTLMIDAAKADTTALKLQQEVFQPRRFIGDLAELLVRPRGDKRPRHRSNSRRQLAANARRRHCAAAGGAGKSHRQCGEVHRARHGRLDVRSARAARGRVRLVFTVTDSGIGLKPAEIKRLFHPFVQANADIARRYGGAGLGLAVVKALARLMDGDLTVTSKLGRGSSFRSLGGGRRRAGGDRDRRA